MKKQKKDTHIDPRVKRKLSYWNGFRIIFLVLISLAIGQALIYNSYVGIDRMPVYFIFSMIGFWAIVTLVIISVIFYQQKYYFDKPMKMLSQAAKTVAEGDFSVSITPVHKQDKYDYIDVMFEDFNKMVEELGSIQTLKNDIVGNVSHEMKTPLSVIQSYATALQKEPLSPPHAQEYIGTIVEASRKLDSLITNVLQLNKLENQEIILDIEQLDFSRQLAEAILKYEIIIEQKQLELEIELEENILIASNSSMLDIVWNNILSNAIKFSDPNGEISIKQTSDQKKVYVQITDTGCGMSQATLNNLFDKFYQGDPSRSSEGNGLGMALVLRIVNLLKGSITVESTLGKGTKMVVELPRGMVG